MNILQILTFRAFYPVKYAIMAVSEINSRSIKMDLSNSGASPLEWAFLDSLLEDCRFIVPIVSNPDLKGVGSLLRVQKTRGKIPSVKDAFGRVACLAKWQSHETSAAELKYWSSDPDYGYGFRTGHGGYIAVDCDIDDPDICAAVQSLLAEALDVNWRDIAYRTHGTAARWASILRIEGIDTLPKHVLKWTDDSGNKIEFLGTGQQLACCGRHPSGDHYRWTKNPFPATVISQAAFREFIQNLRSSFPIQVEKDTADPIRVKGKTIIEIDRLADWLKSTGRVNGTGPDGQLYIDCPWEDSHTMDGGPGETVYFPIGSNGYLGGGFKCLHSHCADKTTADFYEWAQSQGFEQTAAADYPDESETAKRSESKKSAPARESGRSAICSMADFVSLIQEDHNLDGVQFNEFCGQIEFTRPVPWNDLDPEKLPANGRYFIRDTDYTSFRIYIEQNYPDYHIRVNDFPKAFEKLAEIHSYHPIKKFFADLPAWDNVPRVDTLLHDYLGAEDSVYTREVMRKTLCAAMQRIIKPGTKFDTMPVLNGPQGIGKSTLLSRLGAEWFNDNISLAGTRDKSAAEGLQQGWIIELSEVDGGLRRSDLESVKAFLSRSIDVYRPAYGRTVETHPRQCVFFGTANSETGYLSDMTGNRRFLNIRCNGGAAKHPWDLTAEEIKQIWAEVKYYVSRGESLILSPEAQKTAEQEQNQALETDEKDGVIMQFVEADIPGGWDNFTLDRRLAWYMNPNAKGYIRREYISVIEIWTECFSQRREMLKKADSIRIAASLLKHGWKKAGVRACGPYGKQRVFKSPDIV